MVRTPAVAGMRPLTPVEQGHLARLRGHVAAAGIDVTDPAAVGALLDAERARWSAAGGGELPAGMLAALGVGIGDLVMARAGNAHWVLRTSIESPAPALLSADGTAAVVPFDDVRMRWEAGVRGWVVDYVDAAAEHLDEADPAPAESPAADAAQAPAPEPAEPAYEPTSVAPLPTRRGAAAPTPTATLPTRQRPVAPPPAAASHPSAAPSAPAPSAAEPTPAAPHVPAHQPPLTGRRALRVPRPRIPGDLASPPSTEVQILALSLLDAVLELACAAAEPSTVVVVAFDAGAPVQRVGDLAEAQRLVATSGRPRGAVAWVAALDEHGYVVEPSAGTPAVLVEAGDAGRETLVVGHRFTTTPVEDVVIVGQGAALL
ncbi:hypothetical protein IC607_10275 [Cellulomonas sp. JH27-2]|uniref:hypothetical protein n=1 Tax=Cellulomonas sp. JH27-2 TaxID=2774139 RepID=UPI00177BF689|nr:hypothetical protein [Cellulomonas sp. JH27-2]MBD8059352.1 hypothetical protein [Cellulomonas sp. JH27-2]